MTAEANKQKRGFMAAVFAAMVFNVVCFFQTVWKGISPGLSVFLDICRSIVFYCLDLLCIIQRFLERVFMMAVCVYQFVVWLFGCLRCVLLKIASDRPKDWHYFPSKSFRLKSVP